MPAAHKVRFSPGKHSRASPSRRRPSSPSRGTSKGKVSPSKRKSPKSPSSTAKRRPKSPPSKRTTHSRFLSPDDERLSGKRKKSTFREVVVSPPAQPAFKSLPHPCEPHASLAQDASRLEPPMLARWCDVDHVADGNDGRSWIVTKNPRTQQREWQPFTTVDLPFSVGGQLSSPLLEEHTRKLMATNQLSSSSDVTSRSESEQQLGGDDHSVGGMGGVPIAIAEDLSIATAIPTSAPMTVATDVQIPHKMEVEILGSSNLRGWADHLDRDSLDFCAASRTHHNRRRGYDENQDAWVVARLWISADSEGSDSMLPVTLLGVFDGHGTRADQVSGWLVERIPVRLGEALMHVLESSSSIVEPLRLQEALQTAVLDLDRQLWHLWQQRSMPDAGSTAVVVLIIPEWNWLVVLNLGDSRAFIFDREGEVQWRSEEHDPAQKNERKRIKRAHGSVVHSGGSYRVNGNLNLSRAFGDFFLKYSDVDRSNYDQAYYPDGPISARADITIMPLDAFSRPSYLLLTSDWIIAKNHHPDQDVEEIMRKFAHRSDISQTVGFCDVIIDENIERSGDDATLIIFPLP